MANAPKLGATGNFPKGKVSADDEGELRMAMGNKEGKVILEFGKPIKWVGLDPSDADALIAGLTKHAKAAREYLAQQKSAQEAGA